MKRKLLSMLLCVCMVVGLMPGMAFAGETSGTQQPHNVAYDSNTESNSGSGGNSDEQGTNLDNSMVPAAPTQTPEEPKQKEMDEAAKAVQELIDALPTVDEAAQFDEDELSLLNEQFGEIEDAFDGLTDGEYQQLNLSQYTALLTALTAGGEYQTDTLAGSEVTFDIMNDPNMQYILYANGTPLYFEGSGGGYGYSRIYIDANRNGYDSSDVELTGNDLPGIQYVGGYGFYLGNSNVYGGSKDTDTTFDPYMTFAGDSATRNIWIVFGGNNGGTLTGNSTINIAGSNIGWGVLGGGYSSTQMGSTTVNMTAGFSNQIFGSGENVTNTGSTYVSISGGSINYVYGGTTGGGTLNGDTNISVSSGTVTKTMYGGNYSGTVNGTTNITVSGGSVSSVVGGNQDSGKVTGNTYITIKDNANVTGWVYGGGAGTNNSDITEVSGSTNITINGGTLNHNIYGGGGWRGAKVGSANITLNGGTVSGDMYGGGEEQSSVTGTAKITLNGGTVPYVLGAGAGFNDTAATVNIAEIYVNSDAVVTKCITTGEGWNTSTSYAVESATLTLNNAATTAYAGKSSSSSATVNLILKNFGSNTSFYNINDMPCSGTSTGFDNVVLENSYVTRTTEISDAVTINSGSILWLNAESVPTVRKLTGNGGVVWLTKNQAEYCTVDDGIHGTVVVRFVDNTGALVTQINGTGLFNEELADSTGIVSLDTVYSELFVRQDKSSVANRLLTTVMTVGDDRTGPTINNFTVAAHGPYSYDASTTALDSESGVKAIYYACYPDGVQTPTAAEIVAENHVGQNSVQFEITDIKTGRLEPATYNIIYAVAVDNAGNFSEIKSARHRTATEYLNNATVRIVQGESLVYTGAAIEPKVEVLFNGEVYDYNWEISYQFNVNVKEASKAVVVVKPGALSDRFIGQQTFNFVIQPKPITITPTAGQSKTYGSTDSTFTYANTSLVGDDTITGTMERTEGETLGTYSYTIGSLSAGSNYILSLAQNSDKFEIVAYAPTIAWGGSTVQNLNWTGSEAAITAPAVTLANHEIYDTDTNGSLLYQYRLSDSADEAANWHEGLPINVGSYVIKANLAAKGNYAAVTSSNQLSLTINPVAVTVTAPIAATELVYDGTEKSGYTTAATTVGDVIPANELVYTYTGTLIDGTTYEAATTKPIKPGTYSLTVSVADDNPDYFGSSTPVTFTIQKAPVTFAVSGNTIKYGESNTTKVTAKWGEDNKKDFTDFTFEYRDSKGETVTEPSDVGTYDIYATITNGNCCHAGGTDVSTAKIGVFTIEPEKYTVTFDANGHGTAPDAITNVIEGTKINAPTAPTASGYTFGGWYKEAGCTNMWNFDTDVVNSATTLYAEWTVAASSGGGGGGGGSSTTTTTTTNSDGSTTTKVTNNSTGTVTETTKGTDGSITITETKKDGTVTETVKDAAGNSTVTETKKDGTITETVKDTAGNTTETVTNTDGSVQTTDKKSDGLTTVINTDTNGKTTAEVTVPTASADADVKVNIPVKLGDSDGTVSVKITYPDGKTETVKCDYSGNNASSGNSSNGTVNVPVAGSASIVILDDFVPLAASELLPFTDVNADRWSYDNIYYVYNNELFKGISDTEFGSLISMNRGMLVTVLYRMENMLTENAAGTSGSQIGNSEDSADGANLSGADAEVKDSVKTAGFADVASGAYYEAAVNWAYKNGIVTGKDETHFAPEDEITREQLAAILYRYAAFKGYTTDAAMGTAGFDDVSEISDYAVSAMTWAVSSGIINGSDNKLMPQGSATREQVAAMVQRFCEKLAK